MPSVFKKEEKTRLLDGSKTGLLFGGEKTFNSQDLKCEIFLKPVIPANFAVSKQRNISFLSDPMEGRNCAAQNLFPLHQYPAPSSTPSGKRKSDRGMADFSIDCESCCPLSSFPVRGKGTIARKVYIKARWV